MAVVLPIVAGVGLGFIDKLFQTEPPNVEELKNDQRQVYATARNALNNDYSEVLKRFQDQMGSYQNGLLERYPERQKEIADLFSLENPAIAEYIGNLKKEYDNTTNRVYEDVKRAKTDELRRFAQIGATPYDRYRVAEGSHMSRLAKAEEILTQKFNTVLAPQAQLAQQGNQAQLQNMNMFDQLTAQAGMANIQGQQQIGLAENAAIGSLYGNEANDLGNIASAQAKQSSGPGAFAKAGANFVSGGITNLIGKNDDENKDKTKTKTKTTTKVGG